LLKTEYLLGSFRNWPFCLSGNFALLAAGAVIGSGNRPECLSKAVLHDGETVHRVPDEAGRGACVGFASMLFANRFLFSQRQQLSLRVQLLLVARL